MPRKKTKNLYWTSETESYVVEYQQESDYILKNLLYEKHLYAPINKMAENLIRKFKSDHWDVPYEDVKHRVVVHITSKIDRFDPALGFKAFSYFSLIGRNYIFAEVRKFFNKKIQNLDIDLVNESDKEQLQYTVEEGDLFGEDDKPKFMQLFADYMDDNFETLFKKEKEQSVGAVVLQIFRTYSDMDFLDKKTLYEIIRQGSNVKTASITRILKSIIEPLHYEAATQYTTLGRIVDPLKPLRS